MSPRDLMHCDRIRGGCDHARHRHTKAFGGSGQNVRAGVGACRVQTPDGACPCPVFRESLVQETTVESS
jgi:hypothetical protein